MEGMASEDAARPWMDDDTVVTGVNVAWEDLLPGEPPPGAANDPGRGISAGCASSEASKATKS